MLSFRRREDLPHELRHQYLVPVLGVPTVSCLDNISRQWSGTTSDKRMHYIARVRVKEKSALPPSPNEMLNDQRTTLLSQDIQSSVNFLTC